MLRIIQRDKFDAVLFDLDGVLTPTAQVHARCWKRMFDDFREHWIQQGNPPFPPFELEADYREYVDGKPRYDGVRSFLASRGVALPEGEPQAVPGYGSICALGNRKNALVNEVLQTEGVKPYPGSLALVRALCAAGFKTAVVSSSKNCQAVLRAARIEELFDARVDGHTAAQLGLPGKPAPAMFLAAARQLQVSPSRAVVVEDALVGVQAARAGGFGLVIGVARARNAEALRAQGADVAVQDLGELMQPR